VREDFLQHRNAFAVLHTLQLSDGKLEISLDLLLLLFSNGE